MTSVRNVMGIDTRNLPTWASMELVSFCAGRVSLPLGTDRSIKGRSHGCELLTVWSIILFLCQSAKIAKMARPREFNVEKAVEDAMNIFWEKGYHRASLSDLLDGMGIARGSFYKAFVSKKNLFLQALALYNVKYVTPAVEYLTADDKQAGLERIQAVFDGVVEGVRNGDTRGCLLCNTAADSSSEDPDIAALVNKMLDRLTKAFGSALKIALVMRTRIARFVSPRRDASRCSMSG